MPEEKPASKQNNAELNDRKSSSDSLEPIEESPPEIDEGPPSGPVDEIQAAIFEAAQEGIDANVDFDHLTKPMPVLVEEEPPAEQVDEVQRALQEAAQKGLSTDVDFDTLPMPALTEAPSPPPDLNPDPATPPPAPVSPDKPADKEPAKPPTKSKAPPTPRPKPVPLSPAPSDLWLVMALFVVFRLLTLFLFRPGGFIRDWSDFDTYFGIAALSDYGLYPFFNFWLEWPPLVPWLAVGAYKLAILLPPWGDDPRLWFILIMGGIFVLFEIGNFILISRLARRLTANPLTISRTLWIYALLFPPLYAMLGFFDGIALFFILLALDLILNDNRSLSALVVGVGIMVKIIPGLMLPVAIRRVWYQYKDNNKEAAIESGLYAVITGLTVFVLTAPFLLVGPQWVQTTLKAIMGRASWETIWAVLEGYYGFGVVLGDRLNSAETNFAVHESWLPWWLITLIFGGVYLFIFTRKANYNHSRNMVAFTGLTTVWLLLYNKGYSPQFLVYLLPFVLLLMPNGRGVTYALILTGLNVLEQPIFFVMLPNEQWLLIFIVVTRFIILMILAFEFTLVLWPLKKRLAVLNRAHHLLPKVLGILALLTMLALIPVTIRAYYTNQLNNSPLGTFSNFMELQAEQSGLTKPRMLISDQATYRQLYPYLHNNLDLQLTDGAGKGFTGAATVPDLIKEINRVWILPAGPQQQRLKDAVATRGTELAAYQFNGVGTASLYSFEANPLPFIAAARFIGGIELLTHQAKLQPEAAKLTLYWRILNPQNQNLTVFTQILNEAGELIAGHDSVPRGGTAPVTSWPVDIIQADTHHIELPPNLPPGDYTIIIGLYNDSGERVRGIDPDGFGFANRAVTLEVLRFQ